MHYSRVKIPAPNDPPAPKGTMTDHQLDAVKRAAAGLFDSFDWSETPEGYSFWGAVYDRLIQIADTRDHRR